MNLAFLTNWALFHKRRREKSTDVFIGFSALDSKEAMDAVVKHLRQAVSIEFSDLKSKESLEIEEHLKRDVPRLLLRFQASSKAPGLRFRSISAGGRGLPARRLLNCLHKLKGLRGILGKEASEHLDLVATDLKRDRRAMLARRFKNWKIRALLYLGFFRSLLPILWRSLLAALALGELIRKIGGK